MELNRIVTMPTHRESVKESMFQAYWILDKVIEMLKRGDSKETILETVDFINERTQHSKNTDHSIKLIRENYEVKERELKRELKKALKKKQTQKITIKNNI